jgi:hypothetical protein
MKWKISSEILFALVVMMRLKGTNILLVLIVTNIFVGNALALGIYV